MNTRVFAPQIDVDDIVKRIIQSFGIAGRGVNRLYRGLLNLTSSRTRVLFEDWMWLFKQATGNDLGRLKE